MSNVKMLKDHMCDPQKPVYLFYELTSIFCSKFDCKHIHVHRITGNVSFRDKKLYIFVCQREMGMNGHKSSTFERL